MPIGSMGDYSAGYWADLLAILSTAILDADFVPNPVSDADASGVI